MKKFISLNQLKLEKEAMQGVIGGCGRRRRRGGDCPNPEPQLKYGIIPEPILRYGIIPVPDPVIKPL